jgi:hypothetical protein
MLKVKTMKKTISLWAISSVFMLSLVADCGKSALAIAPSPIIAQATPKAAPTTAEKIAFRRKTIRTMSEELEQISKLVNAAKYQEAQVTFEKALKKWNTFGGTIKRIAPDRYAKMLPGFANVKKGLYSSAVPLSTLKSDLNGLIQEAKAAVIVSDQQD